MRTPRAIVTTLLVAGALTAPALQAQSTSGSLAGVVRQADGAPVGQAVVQARSQEAGTVRTALTNNKGEYRLESLAPGKWIVAVRLPDGEVSESRVVEVQLQRTVTLDFALTETTSERVVVTAETPRIDPKQTEGKLLVTREQIARMPLSGRVFTDLAKLDSAVGSAGSASFFGERGAAFVVNGQGGRSNSFLVDGLDNNDPVSGTNLNAFYSQQVIQEFTLMTQQYAPEYGRAAGGVLNIVTRQGTNKLGWQAFVQGTDDSLNGSIDFVPQNGGLQNALSRYQVGFNMHGPFKKDKSFFFLAYERQGQDRVVPYTGVTTDGAAGGTMLGESGDDNFFLRTDYNLGSNNTLMVRFNYDDRQETGVNVGGVYTPDNGFTFEERDLGLASTLKTIVSPDIVNELRFMAATSEFDQTAASSLTEISRPSGINGGNALNRQDRDEVRFQLVDNVTVRKGRHTMKFGLDINWSRIDLATGFNPNGGLIYDTDATFDPNDPSTFPVVFVLIDGRAEDTLEDTRFALFAQDSWDLGKRWHLNYGLRYDLSTFVLDGASVDSTIPNGGATRDTDNIAPRFGFTFKPWDSGKVLFRGGAGVFYDKLVMAFPAVAAVTSQTSIGMIFPQGDPGVAAVLQQTGKSFEQLIEEFGIEAIADSLIFEDRFIMRFSTATELETPYVVQYNIGGDVATGSRSAFKWDFLRSLGYNQPLMLDLNPVSGKIPNGVECNEQNLDPDGLVPCHLADPATGSIAAITTEGQSWYWAFDTSWRWQAPKGSWFSASYTLSRSEDTGFDPLKNGISIPPNSADLSGERSRSDGDRRHRMVISGDTGIGWWGLRLSGAGRYASTAVFNVTTGQDNNLDGIQTDRPAGIHRNTGADTPLDALNAFRLEEGLAPVEGLSEPDFFQVDIRLYKPFTFAKQKGQAQVFLQVFNLFDRENVALIEGRATAEKFGSVVALAGPPRTVELGFRIGY